MPTINNLVLKLIELTVSAMYHEGWTPRVALYKSHSKLTGQPFKERGMFRVGLQIGIEAYGTPVQRKQDGYKNPAAFTVAASAALLGLLDACCWMEGLTRSIPVTCTSSRITPGVVTVGGQILPPNMARWYSAAQFAFLRSLVAAGQFTAPQYFQPKRVRCGARAGMPWPWS